MPVAVSELWLTGTKKGSGWCIVVGRSDDRAFQHSRSKKIGPRQRKLTRPDAVWGLQPTPPRDGMGDDRGGGAMQASSPTAASDPCQPCKAAKKKPSGRRQRDDTGVGVRRRCQIGHCKRRQSEVN